MRPAAGEPALLGLAITALCVTAHQPPAMAVSLACLVGVWYVLTAPGYPERGLRAVLAVLLVPLGWVLLAALLG